MNDRHEQYLRDAIGDAVTDVEPTERLGEILQRTTRRNRLAWYAGAGSTLAVAAAVTLVVALGRPDAPGTAVPDAPAEQATSDTTPVFDPTGAPASPVVPVYYVGAGPDGPDAPSDVLYRYFAPGTAGDTLDLLMSTPADPDYRSLWPAGSLAGMSDPEADLVFVRLGDASVHDRPVGMSEREAELAVQQVVYTLRAAFQEPRLAVQFTYRDNPIDQVYGVPTSEPLTNAPALDVLSLMSISDPAEDAAVTGTLHAKGVANSFEASIACWLYPGSGVAQYGPYVGSAGFGPDKLYPWELDVDLSDVPPGRYTFECSTDDPTGGAEGDGAATDTRSISVE